MDISALDEITRAGETYTVEFKSERRADFSDRDLEEAVVCLANGDGGLLLIGVENDGTITGARPRHGSTTDVARVQATIANRTQPSVSCRAELIATTDELTVLAITVPKATQLVGTVQGTYLRRAMSSHSQPECRPYLAQEVLSRVIDSRAQDYARLPILGLTRDDLDPEEFARFRRLCQVAGSAGDPVLLGMSDDDIAVALGVAERDESGSLIPWAGALLLFGRQDSLARWLPQAEVQFQVLSGTSLTVDETWRRPLFAVAEAALERLSTFNRETELEIGASRVRILRLPTPVLRELIANALIHRDYTVNSSINIQLQDATFQVTSAGGFPDGVTLDNLFQVTRPRSPLLSEALKRAGLVERSGRGVKRVFEAMLRTGRRGPDYSKSNRDLVHVLVPLVEGDLALARYFAGEEVAGRNVDLFDLQVLFELKNTGPMTAEEIAELTRQNIYQTRVMLNRLVEDGHAETRGAGRTGQYHLSARLYESLGDTAAYDRVHGFDAFTQRAMVLRHIAANGRITRGEVAELCKLDPSEARKLLRTLLSRGDVVLHGTRRAAFYTLAK